MTMTSPFALLGFAIAAEIVATSALKASDGMTRVVPAVLVVAGYGVTFYLLSLSLRTLPVGFVYAIWSGLGLIGVTLVGIALFAEGMTALKLAGMVLILAGVVLVKGGGA